MVMKMKEANRILVSTFALVIIGIIMVYSSSAIWAEYKLNNPYFYLIRQTLFAIIGFAILIIISNINYKFWKNKSFHIFLISLLLLILVLIPGIGIVRGGARSWIGINQFSLQPAEFIKITSIIVISNFLSNVKDDINKVKNLLIVIFFIGIIFLLIMLQPDLGTGLVILITIVLLLFISGLNIKYLLYSFFVGIIGLIYLIISKPYRLKRITSFLDPWKDPRGSGFQIIQSLYAIVPSGIFGLGLFNSRQKYYYLPEPQTDFIFAIYVEELGLIGMIFLLFLFMIIFYNGVLISLKVKNRFACFLSLGIVLLIFVQFFINISVVIGLLPVTGITLPFISYGGSSLVLNLFNIGILINIGKSIGEENEFFNNGG